MSSRAEKRKPVNPVEKRSQALLMGALLASYSCICAAQAEELKLQPISPEAAQMDAPPPPPQNAASPNNPFGSNIQGQPLNKARSIDEEPRESATPQDEYRLTALEQKAFGTTYSEHEAVDRLDHLEKEVFGSAKQGALGERIARLESKLLGGSAFGGGFGSAFPSNASGFSQGGQGSRPVVQPPNMTSQNVNTAPAQSGWQNPSSMSNISNPAPAQSGWQNPSSMSNISNPAPAQSGWQNPSSMSNISNPAPAQSGWQNPSSMSNFSNPAPAQSGWQNPSSMSNISSPAPAQSGWQSPSNVTRPNTAPAQSGWQSSPSSPAWSGQAPNNAGRPPLPNSQFGKLPQGSLPQSAAPAPSGGLSLDAAMVASSLPFDANAGDYLSAVTAFPGATGSGTTYARWTSFPLRVKVPAGTPESWTRSVEAVIARWGQYLPVKLALPKEEVNAEIIWVNTLPKGVLGVTRLAVKDGRMRTWIYLLRPSFYPPEIPERALSPVFMRELGHVMGLYCKSDRPEDLMYQPPAGTAPAKVFARTIGLSARDINTLRRLYQSPPLPGNLTLNQPMEWATGY